MAVNTQRQLFGSQTAGAKSMEKLSSGFRINRAADDAAGLAISEKMRSQVRGMKQASRNAQDAISVVQTAEGALDEVHSMLQRMKELSVQAASDSNQQYVDRESLQKEVDALTEEINSITEKTQFNKMRLLDGTFKDKHFHVGANANESIGVTIDSMTARGLGLNTGGTQQISNVIGKSNIEEATGSAKAGAITKGTEMDFTKWKSKGATAAAPLTINVDINGKAVETKVIAEDSTGNLAAEAIAKVINDEFGTGTVSAAAGKITFLKDVPAIDLTTPVRINVSTSESNQKAITKDGTSLFAAGDVTKALAAASNKIAINAQLDLSDLKSMGASADNPLKFEVKLVGKTSGGPDVNDDTLKLEITEDDADGSKIAAKLTSMINDKYGTGTATSTGAIVKIGVELVKSTSTSTPDPAISIKLKTPTAPAILSEAGKKFLGTGKVAEGKQEEKKPAEMTIDYKSPKVDTEYKFKVGNEKFSVTLKKSASQNDAISAINNALKNSKGEALAEAKADGTKIKITSKADGTTAKLSAEYAGESALKDVNYIGINVLTREEANKSLENVQDAIESLASRRASLGAIQNRVEHTIKNLDNSHENLMAAESRVRHVDMAKEIIENTRQNILQQAATSMLAQANQAPQTVLQLLR